MMVLGQLEVWPNSQVSIISQGYVMGPVAPQFIVTTSSTGLGIYSIAYNATSACAITGNGVSDNDGTGIAIGVKGTSITNSNNNNGKNYGVIGALTQYNMGTGILGAISNSTFPVLSGSYAGYFAGNVHITTKLTVNTTTYNSDYRYKQNIEELNRQKTFENVLSLNPVEYNLKQRYLDAVDTLGNSIKMECFDEKSPIFQKKHYGLIAQEVQKLYPDLVYEDGDGYLSIDYIGIIPLLIQSVKELSTKIEQMEIANAGAMLRAQTAQQTDVIFTEQNEQPAALYQNSPNPFSQNTEIKYYLPASVNSASLCIYDLYGKQLKQIRLSQRNTGSQIISASELPAGIYLYALIADGKEIDVKRMILTE